MITYFYKVADSEIYYIDKSNLNFKQYVKQLKHDYITYKKNKTGYRYIFDLLESDNFKFLNIVFVMETKNLPTKLITKY